MGIVTENEYLRAWVKEVQALCQPDNVHLIDGSAAENSRLCELLVSDKTFIPLNPEKHPGSYLARSNPEDVARVEDRTFICCKNQLDAGPTNNWKEPESAKKELTALFSGCMKGRTMYVVPYCMGPVHSPFAKVAVEITDSPYVVVNMGLMTRMGKEALKRLGKANFVRCLHSVGKPLDSKSPKESWPCNPSKIAVCHFPETKEVWSFGSGYGGNALLNKKSFALRIASTMAHDEGWLAEHMLIVGVTNPEGVKRYFAASFPSACGKTNLAMLTSALPGWKVECVGDDIAWMHWGQDGRLYAINPEAGFFGVAPGTSMKSNPNAMRMIAKNTIFTNAALTDDGDVWWEQMTTEPPKHLVNWQGKDWTQDSAEKAAHPNARFTVASKQCPIIDPKWEEPLGVPISGIIFGGRRASTVPLVRQALSWEHGVFLGASMTSETTAAASGEVGRIRHDPFAMLPFCGYNMGEYFAHWLSMEKETRHMPSIFYVNWFRKNRTNQFVWPGFGENIRILEWCFKRIENKAGASETPIGFIPRPQDINLEGLVLSPEALQQLLEVDKNAWTDEAEGLERYFMQFGETFPRVLINELETLKEALRS